MVTQQPNATRKLPLEKIRSDFPVLAQTVNNHPLVYLDSAATTQKPQVVIDAVTRFYSEYNSNVHRGVHTLSERATQAYENARSTVQHFINAKSFQEIVFVRGTTEAINLVANSFVAPRIEAGEEILLSEMEHHSNIVPWQIIAKRTGANLRVIPITDEGEINVEAFHNMLTPKAKFLALNHISNALGTINPIKEMISAAHDNNMLVLIDGAQAAPHCRIDVRDLDCDFYAFSGHKVYGPTGVGVLYAKEHLLDSAIPYQGGGEMISHVTFEKTEYKASPFKFEAGTPNISGAIGLAAALDYVSDIGLDVINDYERGLMNYLLQQVSSIEGIGYIGSAKNRASIFSFVLKDIHAHDVGTILNSLGIAVRSGHHCAMPVMDRFQIAASTRASLSFYNTREEIDRFIEAIERVEGIMG